MKKIRTHYDNLKVARNAPLEVIRAAYRSLSQLYHPDKNPNDSESVRIMAIINHSYEVLSDDNKRKLHDEWINSQEGRKISDPEIITNPKSPSQQNVQKPNKLRKHNYKYTLGTVILHLWEFRVLYFIVILVGFFILYNNKNHSNVVTPPYQKVSPPVEAEIPRYVRPSTDPYGRYWPSKADYLTGQKIRNAKGYSKVTIDNGRNDSDVHAKLVYYDQNKSYTVREFYIPAFGSLTLNKISQGNYDIRYRDLSSGSLHRSESFKLEERKTIDGTEFSEITMTLYKVQNGNMQTYSITENEF